MFENLKFWHIIAKLNLKLEMVVLENKLVEHSMQLIHI